MKKKTIKDIFLVIGLLILCGLLTVGLPLGLMFVLDNVTDIKVEMINGKTLINNGDLEAVITKGYYIDEDNRFYIEGILRNNTNDDYEYINLTFYVYDNENNILGEAICSLPILQSNASWKFKAEYYETNRASEVASYKLVDVEFY